MKSSSLAVWLGSAFGAALGLAIIVLGFEGAGVKGTEAALAATARFSFLLFLPAYAGGAMATLFGPAFLPLKRRAREFGLAFATAHLVHIGLVAWLCRLGAVPSVSTFVFFGIAALWLYLIAVFSIGRLQQKLHPTVRKFIFVVGLNYIAYAFAADFFKNPLHGGIKHTILYLPFTVLAITGPVLRLAAFLLRRR
jgi:hypothetical protein